MKNDQGSDAFNNPLGTVEINQLNALMPSHSGNGKGKISYAHGFFTAVASSPNEVPFKVSCKYLLADSNQSALGDGKGASSTPTFILLHRLYCQISHDLSMMNLHPIVFDYAELISCLEASFSQIKSWCEGYIEGVKMDFSLTDREEVKEFMLPIHVLAGKLCLIGERSTSGEVISNDLPYKKHCQEKLSEHIMKIYKLARMPTITC